MDSGKRRRLVRVAVLLLLLLAVLLVSLSFYVSRLVIHPYRTFAAEDPSDYGMDYENVTFRSPDGLELKGWLAENEGSDSVIILCHGHGSNRGRMLPFAEFLHRGGYSVFLFDFRAHGENPGDIATLGWLEPMDLMGAAGYVEEKLDPESIGVMGFSMGGATAITTAGQISEIEAVVADSAFADRADVISRIVNVPPVSWMVPALVGVQGISMSENLPRDYAGNISPSALMIIQGDMDHLVSVDDAELLYARAGEPKELWIVEGAPHVLSYLVEKYEYEKRVLEFFGSHLRG